MSIDFKVELESAKKRQQVLVDQINAKGQEINKLNEERQTLLQEALKIEGECGLLERLSQQNLSKEK